MKERKSIIVLLRNRPFFGSRITSLPAIFYLRKNYPDHKIIAVGHGRDTDFYSMFDWIDETIESKSIVADINNLPRRPDILISFQPSSERGILIKYLKKPRSSAGFYKSNNMLSSLWENKLKFDKKEYRATHYLRLTETLASGEIDMEKSLRAPFLHLANKSEGPEPGSDNSFNIVLMPGGGAGEFKKWGYKNFIETAAAIKESLSKETKIKIILGPDEKNEELALKEDNPIDVELHCSPSLGSLCKTIYQSDLVIANDCGPSHIAQCLGIPFLGIYKKQDSEWFRKSKTSMIITPEAGEEIKKVNKKEVITASLSLIQATSQAFPIKSASKG